MQHYLVLQQHQGVLGSEYIIYRQNKSWLDKCVMLQILYMTICMDGQSMCGPVSVFVAPRSSFFLNQCNVSTVRTVCL